MKTQLQNWHVTVCRKHYKIESNGRAVAWVDIDSPNSEAHARQISALPKLMQALRGVAANNLAPHFGNEQAAAWIVDAAIAEATGSKSLDTIKAA